MLLALHGEEELLIGLGVFEAVEQEFNRWQVFHAMQQFAQNPHPLQFFLAGQQLLTASARAANIDGRIDTLLGDFAVQVQFGSYRYP